MQKMRKEVRNFVGGRWEERNGQATEPVYDPATGKAIAETPLSSREDVDRAVKAAEEAFPSWHPGGRARSGPVVDDSVDADMRVILTPL